MSQKALPYFVNLAQPLESAINANQNKWFIPTLAAYSLSSDPNSIYHSSYLFLCKDLWVRHEFDIISNLGRSAMYYDTEQEALDTLKKYNESWVGLTTIGTVDVFGQLPFGQTQIKSEPLFND